MSATQACPVQFSILKMDFGHTLLKVDFEGKSNEFHIANYLNSDFFDLMQVLFWMNPAFYRESLETLRTGPSNTTSYDAPTDAFKLYWNLEGSDVYVTLHTIGEIPDGNVELKIEVNGNIWIQAVVPYKSLCYTVVKAINDLMAKQGLLGICWTNESKDLNLRYFLHLKAFAMDLDPIDAFDGFTSFSNLDNDLKLLDLPMP